jgi:hypothetical protein
MIDKQSVERNIKVQNINIGIRIHKKIMKLVNRVNRGIYTQLRRSNHG